jgi:hypothetical protein
MKFCSYFYYFSNKIRIKTRCKKTKTKTKQKQNKQRNQGNLYSTPPYVDGGLIDKRKLLKSNHI